MHWRAVAFGLAVYVVALLASAPATLLDVELQHSSAGRLRLAQARGTIWSGAGDLEVLGSDGRIGIARPFAWTFRPQALLRGELRFDVALGERAKRFPVMISGSGFRLARAHVQLPAAVLGFAVPQLAPLELIGNVSLNVSQLADRGGKLHGKGVVQWRGAGSRLSPVSPLGDYALRLDADGTMVHASVRTLRGPVALAGSGAWAIGGRPTFTAIAVVPPQDEPKLGPLLRLIGVARGGGRFELQLNRGP